MSSSNINKYNAILLGLGNIGQGHGEYSYEWNNHLFSLSNVNWIDKVFLIDPYVNLKPLLSNKILIYNPQIIKKDNKKILYVDAGPAKNRINRVLKYKNLFEPEFYFIEKPNNYSTQALKKIPSNTNIKVNYYRRSLNSTKFLKTLVKRKANKIIFNFNNGIENTASHFFDLLDFLGYKIENLLDLKIRADDNYIFLSDFICMKFVNHSKPIFEIKFKCGTYEVCYSDFGNKISKDNENWYFKDNNCRFQNIYNELSSIKKLTDFKKDVLVYKLINKIKNAKIAQYKNL